MNVAGHGRVEAAKAAEIALVLTIVVGADWTPAQRRAYVLADNPPALNAGWDDDLLKQELVDPSAESFECWFGRLRRRAGRGSSLDGALRRSDRRGPRAAQAPRDAANIPSSEVEMREHPTSKTVRVLSLPMELHTLPGVVCYEPLSGSGSQHIGGENTGRTSPV